MRVPKSMFCCFTVKPMFKIINMKQDQQEMFVLAMGVERL